MRLIQAGSLIQDIDWLDGAKNAWPSGMIHVMKIFPGPQNNQL